ncbi:AAA family ATPase [Frigidibacter oleivorans]|uniref:AAA family ATPase n=1 Tax=Frigidibacter oleivorans TaxID=2487129 RepID=UPI000F8DF85F|nr:ATP-binding protein [Frigidibacter oleivorans]
MREEKHLYGSVAPLRNVAALVALIDRVQGRGHGLPGMATFYGPSGFGKSTACVYATTKFRAYTVQIKSTWTAKKFCEAVLIDLGLKPARITADMVDQISEELARTGRPLLIDEADHLIDRRMVELVRDIYESSGAAIVLIGEERLPQKLQTWERVHGRMLDWVAAEPGDMHDLLHLAPVYCPGLEIEEDLRQELVRQSAGSIRRICVNLDRLAELARTLAVERVGRKEWGSRRFFSGEAPPARREFRVIPGARREIA